ncbi:MAG: nicotinamide mononucleotide transporter PnuC, partial [Erysipelotrichaceae bacterium]|nr:nicotinamide mononucleotide transporter PnuC [Erysipelotrichaceae bacterium]
MKNWIEKIKTFTEPNKKIRTAETVVLILLRLGIIISFGIGLTGINRQPGELKYLGQVEMVRDRELEDYDEDSTVCDVVYVNGEDSITVTYTYEEYEELETDKITAYGYQP